ncbi:MAG: hypothetical protein K0Q79_2945 [Flavipsychrobacter sp.]|jgi:hypothetical protein|nr:hypothetical protein [Flavipsychrobacter sp.]
MKKFITGFTALSMLLFSVTACKKKTNNTPVTPTDPNGYVLNADITANRTLVANSTYTLEAMVYVKNGATLTIPEGVTIKVSKGKNALVITRGAKIMATGTVDKPIVFTSAEAAPSYGDWGGIVILGRATTNTSFNSVAGQGEIEGGVNNSAGDGIYGGTDDADNSGKLKYVRIEYGGYPFQPDKELNSLTMGAVGSGTEIDYVEVMYGYDDAFEWFGGSVNAKHLISYKTLDDDFDTDFGFHGKIQFAIAIRDKDKADVSGSNGFESDNDASGTTTTPFTAPVFANVTVIGPKQDASTTISTNFKRAAHIRRNSRMCLLNSILIGYPTGILIDGSKCGTNLINGDIELKGNIVGGMTKSLDTTGTTSVSLNLTTLFSTTGWGNEIKSNTSEAGLTAAYGAGSAFDPSAASGSVAASGAVTSTKLTSFFTTTTFRGAVGVGDTWWKTWSKF